MIIDFDNAENFILEVSIVISITAILSFLLFYKFDIYFKNYLESEFGKNLKNN